MSVDNTNSIVHGCDSEPLYLLIEDNNEVSVNNFLMEQHQIDGLRFLFKQFKKKLPGVIVNFPASTGKSTTVAIFLNTVSSGLKNPVLVLCKDDSEIQYWMRILLKWSSYVVSDIEVESVNPFIKGKKVFLKKRDNLHSYLRRRWSIVIVKENDVNKDVFKFAFEADFRICITSTDIKKDSFLLSAIFNWLYPKPKVNISDFFAKGNSLKEKFRKSVQLNVMLEDVAIREYINIQPFQTEKADNMTETNMTIVKTNPGKGSIKNKDATGTKVKRSKIPKKNIITASDTNNSRSNQKIYDMSAEAIISTKYCVKNNINRDRISSHDSPIINVRDVLDTDFCIVNDNHEKVDTSINVTKDHESYQLDVENFIREQKPIEPFDPLEKSLYEAEAKIELLKSPKIDDFGKIEQNEKIDLVDKDFLKEQLIQSLNIDDSKDDFKGIIDFDEELVKKETTETNSLTIDNNSKLNLKEIKDLRNELIESLDFDSGCTIARNKISNSDIKNDSKFSFNDIKDIRNKCLLEKQLIESLDINSKLQEIKNRNDNNNIEFDGKDFNKNLVNEESTESLSFDIDSDGKQYEIIDPGKNEVNDKFAESLNFGSNPKVDFNETKDLRNKDLLQKQLIESLGLDDDKVEINNVQNEEKIAVLENTQTVVNEFDTDLENDEIIVIKEDPGRGNEEYPEENVNNKRKSDASDKDLDSKILEMEERALKKFKGSFLDSIF